MKIDGVPEILAAILNEDDDDLAKEVYHPDADYEGDWTQIGGDFGDPWTYGGDWLNAHKKELLHFDGIETETEFDYRAIEIPERVMAKIKAKVHDPYLDTPEGQEDPEWLKRQLRYEEYEIDRITDNYRVARCSFLEDRRKYQFWQVDLDQNWLEDSLKEKADQLGRQFEAGVWDTLPFEQKVIELGRYNGFNDIGHDLRMNRIEAMAMLKTPRKNLRTD